MSAKMGETDTQTNLPIFVVDHNVVGLHVSVHNSFAMAKVERLTNVNRDDRRLRFADPAPADGR